MVYVKVISNIPDNIPYGVINSNYNLAVYSNLYTNENGKRLVPLEKIENIKNGAVYLGILGLPEGNNENFLNGQRFFIMEIENFTFQGSNLIQSYIWCLLQTLVR